MLMIDEKDISTPKSIFYQQRAEAVIKNLQRRNINGQYAATRAGALAAVMDLIPPGAVVVRGDSISVDQIGVLDEIIKRDQNKLVNFFKTNPDGTPFYGPEDRYRMEREAFSADIYLTGSNAITLDGKIINVDGMGNRVSAMIFGPRKVILVIGINKIENNEEEARERIRNIAAPLNAIRHFTKHKRESLGILPCVRTGRCVDCSSEARICRYTVIIEGADIVHKGRINVVLVGEELGI
jgi:hypothetical protein